MAIHLNGETKYEGKVLGTYEENGYRDSDFKARVWDDEEETVKSIEYDTTRFAGGGSAHVDATDEVREKVAEYAREKLFRSLKQQDRKESRTPKTGRRVRVVSGRKVEPGTEGLLFWIGDGKKYGYYSDTTYKVGISPSGETDDEGRHPDAKWTYKKHLEVVNPEQYDTPEEELQEVVDSLDDPWGCLKHNRGYAKARLKARATA